MERIIEIESVETTADCISALNEKVRKSKWKRKVKFNIVLGMESSVVRVFSDSADTLSIVQGEYETHIYNYDISKLRPMIEQIQKVAKSIYTFDYGEIYLNPWENQIWVVGGDGGIVKAPISAAKIVKMIESGISFPESYYTIDFGIPEIKETRVEAEYFPPVTVEDLSDHRESIKLGWIQVARATDLSDLM